jgi:hypothetical protein
MSLKKDLSSQPDFFIVVKQFLDHARFNGFFVLGYLSEIRRGLEKYDFGEVEKDLETMLTEADSFQTDVDVVSSVDNIKKWAEKWSEKFDLITLKK